MKKQNELTVVQKIQSDIIQLPGRPLVMLTREVAELYQVTPRQITQAVRRNPKRFPDGFVFELTPEEITWLQNESRLSTQTSTSYNVPLAFTREGANQLSTVLRSDIAIERSLQIVKAFTAMEREAERVRNQKQNLDWKAKRLDGKSARRDLTDEIKVFVVYATAQGSKSARWYYKSLTTQVYAALFLLEKELGESFRDTLDGIQLMHLGSAESITRKALDDGMDQQLPYKAIYQLARGRVELFAEVLGKTKPGQGRKALAQ